MEAEFNHLNHATWECKYHVVFTPKYPTSETKNWPIGNWSSLS